MTKAERLEEAWRTVRDKIYWDAPHWNLLIPNNIGGKEAEKLVSALEQAFESEPTIVVKPAEMQCLNGAMHHPEYVRGWYAALAANRAENQ